MSDKPLSRTELAYGARPMENVQARVFLSQAPNEFLPHVTGIRVGDRNYLRNGTPSQQPSDEGFCLRVPLTDEHHATFVADILVEKDLRIYLLGDVHAA